MQKSCARFERLGSIVGVTSGIGVQALVGRAQTFIKLDLAIATEEVKIYLKAGPNIGLTRDDVREVLMQTAIYCGIPAALDSFRAAQEVFDEQDRNTA